MIANQNSSCSSDLEPEASHPRLLSQSRNLLPLRRRRLALPNGNETLLFLRRLDVPGLDVTAEATIVSSEVDPVDHRLKKHADYQRVYREGRKQFSSSMSYFFAMRSVDLHVAFGPRVGLTAGKVLGKAVERNRIKRRMRDIVRRRVDLVKADVDIVLHPKKSVLTADFAKLEAEVVRIFNTVQASVDKHLRTSGPALQVKP